MKSTDVVIVADCSGSMGHLQFRQQEAIWALLQQMAGEERAAEPHLFQVSIHPFGSQVGGYFCTPFRPASGYVRNQLDALECRQGSTRLLDAVGHAIEAVKARNPDAALVQVFTDGQENASTRRDVPDLLKAEMAKGYLTVALTGPQGAGRCMANCGLPDDNFRPWDGVTEKSYGETVQATQSAVSTYTTQRKAGVRSSTSYYVDPSKLSTSGVRSHMQQVQPTEVKTVSDRMAGRAIADAFSKFEKGKHYYQLMKPEYIQEDKELVVHIKDQNEFRLGSRSARILLGLPETGRIRVRPAETTAPFDVYVQSASVNRKLVKGQKLLTIP